MKAIHVLVLLCLSIPLAAQQAITTIKMSDSIRSTAIDRPGDFYVITKGGQIQRFDKNGKLTLLYKTPQLPTLFDPRDGARLFAYYRDGQHYQFLSPSFEPITAYRVDSSFAIQPWLICPSGEYKLWILDNADNSLKKVDGKTEEVVLEVIVDSTLIQNARAFTAMREYQSFLFLLNPAKGILIFSSLGKHIRTVELTGVNSFNFLGEEMYYLRKNNIEFFNLFSAETRRMEVAPEYTDALLTDERLILFTPGKINVFPFRP